MFFNTHLTRSKETHEKKNRRGRGVMVFFLFLSFLCPMVFYPLHFTSSIVLLFTCTPDVQCRVHSRIFLVGFAEVFNKRRGGAVKVSADLIDPIQTRSHVGEKNGGKETVPEGG